MESFIAWIESFVLQCVWLFGWRQRTPKLTARAEGFVIGEALTKGGQGFGPVLISDAERARHVYIIGATGTGKTTLLLRLFEEDVRLCR